MYLVTHFFYCIVLERAMECFCFFCNVRCRRVCDEMDALKMQSLEDVEVGVDGGTDFVGRNVLVGGVRARAVAGVAYASVLVHGRVWVAWSIRRRGAPCRYAN